MKMPRNPILRTPARPTPKALTAPKSVKIQSETIAAMPAPIPNPTPMGTLVSVLGEAQPKFHRVDGTPLLPPTNLPSPSQPQLLVPRRILSSTPSGENGEDVDRRGALIKDHEEKRQILRDQKDRRGMLIKDHEEKRQILRDQNRKIFHPLPIEVIDIGVMEGLETLDPEIRIHTDKDFVLPPPLESLLDKAKMAYKFFSQTR